MAKKKRINGAPRAHLCGMNGCKRITLRSACEKCSLRTLLAKVAHGAQASA